MPSDPPPPGTPFPPARAAMPADGEGVAGARPWNTAEVLEAEFRAIHGDAAWRGAGPDDCREALALLHPANGPEAHDRRERVVEAAAYCRSVHALEGAGQSALCLSGGGIRSAAFGLGVLQGLARRGLLGRFHYLSTVSGGGYVGGWLTAWAHRRARAGRGGFAALEDEIGHRRAYQDGEPGPLRWLRTYQGMLSPRVGASSPDTWTGIAAAVRNLLLNWLVFVPLLAALLLLPRLAEALMGLWALDPGAASSLVWLLDDLVAGDGGPPPADWWSWTDTAALLLMSTGLGTALAKRPDHGDLSFGQGRFALAVLAPVCVGAFLLLMAISAWWFRLGAVERPELRLWVLLGAACFVLARLVAAVRLSMAGRPQPGLLVEVLALAVVGAAVGGMIHLGVLLYLAALPGAAVGGPWDPPAPDPRGNLRFAVVLGLPWLLGAFLLGQVLYAGLTSRAAFGERDREWLARSSGWYGAVAVTWLAFSGLVLFGAGLLAGAWAWTLATAAGSGAFTLAGGASGLTRATGTAGRERLPVTVLVALASGVFLCCLAVLLAEATAWALEPATAALLGADRAVDLRRPPPFTLEGAATRMVAVATAALLLAASSLTASWFVNVNHFSLHAAYRNRLVRMFLGASNDPAVTGRPARRNGFDGFSEDDDLPLADLAPDPDGPRPGAGGAPFPVVNVALNVAAAGDLARQERRAAPFVATPLHAGGDAVGYRAARGYGGGDGLTLGTAMAISGAAVSPNAGYHSAPLTSFLMMLFNLRLGWWLGNPGHPRAWRLAGPFSSARLFAQEALGRTSTREPWVYLSDGGHFDNLGLHEMLRRRCRTIVVSDATADPDCTLADLGRAVRAAAIDLGVTVDFERIDLRKRGAETLPSGVYCAIGTIRYPEAGATGVLVYLKPGLYGDAPADVRAYAAANARFPHDSTGRQWFGEAQFESYRSLGAHVVRVLCEGGAGRPVAAGRPAPMTLGEFQSRVADYLRGSRGGAPLPVRLVS